MTANPTTAATSAANLREKLRQENSTDLAAALRSSAAKARRLGDISGGMAEHYAALAEALEGEARQLEEGAS